MGVCGFEIESVYPGSSDRAIDEGEVGFVSGRVRFWHCFAGFFDEFSQGVVGGDWEGVLGCGGGDEEGEDSGWGGVVVGREEGEWDADD